MFAKKCAFRIYHHPNIESPEAMHSTLDEPDGFAYKMQANRTEICYGALFGAIAKPCSGNKNIIRQEGSPQLTDHFSFFNIAEQTTGIFKLFSGQVNVAVLDTSTTSKLMALRRIPGVRYEAVVEIRTTTKRKAKLSSPFNLSVNIYGLRQAADEVSRALSTVSDAFLQHPQVLGANVEYHNPDMLVFSGQETNMNHLVGASTSPLVETQLSRDVRGILDSINQVTETEKLDHNESLVTTLTEHQRDGVRFVLQREDPSFSTSISEHLTRCFLADRFRGVVPPAGLGGLIADVMGLGKTLTMLASILYSADKALDDAYFDPAVSDPDSGPILTKATLVVVPSVQLMENWESEILRHFSDDALQHLRFHGSSRPRTVEALKAPDVILTTYATLAADHDGPGLLYNMEWYRVVLDEAHYIRNSTTKQCRAAINLRARRRWCLSGTPIQNAMEDLASLAQFLQLAPLCSKDAFDTYVLRPLSEPVTNSKPLRAFMEAYCLRRTESCLSLPLSREEVVPLHLSLPERSAYDNVLRIARNKIDDAVSSGQKSRCTQLFTALLRMRMLCNTGTYRSVGAATLSINSSQTGLPSMLQGDCARCSAGDEDSLLLLASCEVCPDCLRPFTQRSPSPFLPSVSQLDGGDTVGLDQQQFSTKLDAVKMRLVNAKDSNEKAIVFSYWKSTLRILATLLQGAGVECVQVDGNTSFADRSTRLRSFKQDQSTSVLLMTVGVGAVGLNLTVANQVHIVEPQWNPSVEEQAVARAVRMGQEREVTIFRYVLQNTVEQSVVKLQEKKRSLAKFTLGARSDQNISNAVHDLETVLELNARKRTLEEI